MEKFDSYIEGKTFKEVTQPKGDKFSIRLNTAVDDWAGLAREQHSGPYPQYMCPESRVMVQRASACFLYGDACKVVTEDINQEKMFEYLWGKNEHWGGSFFASIDLESVETCMKNLGQGWLLKLGHEWQNDGQQRPIL